MKRRASKKPSSPVTLKFLSKSPKKWLTLTDKEKQELERTLALQEQAKKTKFTLGGPIRD